MWNPFRWFKKKVAGAALRRAGIPITDKETETMIKSGWKTTEFWLMILSLVVKVTGIVDLPTEAIATIVAYIISRGLAKKQPTPPTT